MRPLPAIALAALLAIRAAPAAADDSAPPPTSEEAPEGERALQREIAALQETLSAHPEDVDLRLRLALRLSWIDRRDEARRHAEKVVDDAPEYWDAHILLARLDAWDKKYSESIKRLERVINATPDRIDAIELLSKVALWANELERAEAATRGLIEREPTAERYYRLAQIYVQRRDTQQARYFARRALALDPTHKGAKAVLESARFARVYATSKGEYFEQAAPDQRVALSQTLVLALLPTYGIGVAFTYDFHRRFGTDNHRIGARLNWQFSEHWLFSAFLRAGRSPVLPQYSGDAGLIRRLGTRGSVGLRYHLDRMSWDGTLHRASLFFTAQLHERFSIEGLGFGGIMRHCGESDGARGGQVRARYQGPRVGVVASYGYGTELERPPLAAFLSGQEDICLATPGQSGSPLDLAETRAHDVSGALSYHFADATQLTLGYGYQRRDNRLEAHSLLLGLYQGF